MRLIIMRHGETLGNSVGIIQGHLPGKLSEKGIEQAKRVALRLKDERIDLVLCSDLTRAMETAKEIKFYHPNVPFFTTKDLRETYFGEWEGKARAEVGFKEGYKPPLPKDAETREESHKRAQKFLEEIKQKYAGENILVIAHNAINKALIAVLLKKGAEEIKNMETQHNTGVSIFELSTDGNCQNILYNCKKHLE